MSAAPSGSGASDVPARSERVGVFGGTFDPPHRGHVEVVRDVADRLRLDRVLWLPARASPFKRDRAASSAEDRRDMVREAVALDSRFEVDERELHRAPPSYTVDTLASLRRELPDAELFLIVGADQFRDFPRWREPGRIVRLARLAVMNRAGRSPHDDAARVSAAVPGLEDAVEYVDVRDVDVSSTAVREAIGRGENPAGALPEGVAGIIRARGLYGR